MSKDTDKEKIELNGENNMLARFAFNIWDIESAKAVMDAAKIENQAVILQTSTNIYSQLPTRQLREFITSYAKDSNIEVVLHLDHCRNLEIILNAISSGWDSVMIDASNMELKENIRLTNEVTERAHAEGVLVEAEVGQVKGVEDDINNKNESAASRNDIKQFLERTNVDMIAVAFGNAHGIYSGQPCLDYSLVEYTTQLTDIPFVVHGGSGLSDEVLVKLLSIQGVKKINISTEVKLAYRKGLEQVLMPGCLNSKSFQPIQVNRITHDAIQEVVLKKLRLNKLNH